ncbi:MAG: hypothetical protein AAGF95_13290 [Chloroflexota bacterium]
MLPTFPATLRAIAALILLMLPGALLALRLFDHPAERDVTTWRNDTAAVLLADKNRA